MNADEVVVVGFDSAWTDRPARPGAICAARYKGGTCVEFHPPKLALFSEARSFIDSVERPGVPLLVAIDQPTIVKNATGSRPADKVAGSLVSWLGGGVQPANRGKLGMFDDPAPLWSFLSELQAGKSAEDARTASSGRHVIEVFPALALPAVEASFYGRGKRPSYNPDRRKTFKLDHWHAVLRAVAAEAKRLGCPEAAEWVSGLDGERVRKCDQDCLDAVICLLVGLRWRLEPPERSVLIGCLDHGFIVAPVTPEMRDRLCTAASLRGVPIDGKSVLVPGKAI